MWVGTGESWTRNSVSVGNGVYKSTDGGETWTNVGLPERERITRIVVNPKNGNIVYVCAPGALWSDSPDRGLYKTTDGGKTWSLILKGANLSTGCSSVAMDPANPEHLLAGTWDFRRKPYEFRSGGNGPDAPSGSRFAESHDGGRTWTYLNADESQGPSAAAVGPARDRLSRRPIRSGSTPSSRMSRPALFVSEDGGHELAGARPQPRHGLAPLLFRPDRRRSEGPQPPVQDGLIRSIVSDDGGKSFSNGRRFGPRRLARSVDRPERTPSIMVGGDDGGLWYSYDGGNRWWNGAEPAR